jgi:O-acetyl-ADP-ribose deacetylase (regulator of RNase III)
MTQIELTKDDITRVEVDAIVNAANSRLAGGGGVDGAIHRAGGPSILEECQRWVADHGALPTGEAMATTGGNLPAQYVIHTVGPVWASHDEETARELLASCYRTSLVLAAKRGCSSVAFPNISTGVYGYPKEKAAHVAVSTAREWDGPSVEVIVFVCFDEENLALYSDLLDR